MDASGYHAFDATACADRVKAGETDAAELLGLAMAAVEQTNPGLGAVVHAFPDLAEAQIREGVPPGPFAGVPLLVKDAGLSIHGTPLTAGSRLFENRICTGDDTLALRLKAAGFVPFGRTKTPEFSLSFTSEPEAFGSVCNPWAFSRSAGGSSGGSAAAVAAGLVPVAHATDGAGSIRVPAAHCGVFGFKPSRMRNPMGPTIAEGNAGMGTPHAITRSVRDSAALLDATCGPDIGDPYAVETSTRRFAREVVVDPPALRIGLWRGISICSLDPHCAAALADAADLCAGLGHHVEDAAPDIDHERLRSAWRLIAGVGTAQATASALADDEDTALRLVEPVNREWIEEGRRQTATAYLAAVNDIHAVGRAMGTFFQNYDILLSPVTSAIAPPIGELAGRGLGLDAFFDRFWGHAPFTPPFNASGGPAMSVPLHWTPPLPNAPLGLPVGVQFGAARGRDALLFSLAGQLERARPWADRRPPVFAATENRHGNRI